VDVIIAGSRWIDRYKVVERAIAASGFHVTTVLSGAARGVDRLGEQWANLNTRGLSQYPAEWDRYGKRAGILRNQRMARDAAEADEGGLIAVWDGTSRGTRHMIEEACRQQLKVHVHLVTPQPSTKSWTEILAFNAIIKEIAEETNWPISVSSSWVYDGDSGEEFVFPDVSRIDEESVPPVALAPDGIPLPASHGHSKRRRRGRRD
jgi:hypothetical protein